MSIVNKHFPFVKDQISFQERMVRKFSSDPKRQKLHQESAAKFKELMGDLEAADKKLDDPAFAPKPLALIQQLSLFPKEYEDLPDELKKELSISEADKTEHMILALMEEAGGIISLDRILVGLYTKTGDIHKRVTMTSRMYRMSQKGYAYPVPGKKGVYSIRQLTEDEVTKLFASVPEESAEGA